MMFTPKPIASQYDHLSDRALYGALVKSKL